MAYCETHEEICKGVKSLSWIDLQTMAEQLSEFINTHLNDGNENISSAELASILYFWADGQIESYESQKAKANDKP